MPSTRSSCTARAPSGDPGGDGFHQGDVARDEHPLDGTQSPGTASAFELAHPARPLFFGISVKERDRGWRLGRFRRQGCIAGSLRLRRGRRLRDRRGRFRCLGWVGWRRGFGRLGGGSTGWFRPGLGCGWSPLEEGRHDLGQLAQVVIDLWLVRRDGDRLRRDFVVRLGALLGRPRSFLRGRALRLPVRPQESLQRDRRTVDPQVPVSLQHQQSHRSFSRFSHPPSQDRAVLRVQRACQVGQAVECAE
jgi:hypothetical protein